MLLAKSDNIFFSYQRFAACEQIHKSAESLALRYYAAHFFITEIELVAVLSCPASYAMLVARTGRVEKYGPRDVAVILLFIVKLHVAAYYGRVNDEVTEDSHPYIFVDV